MYIIHTYIVYAIEKTHDITLIAKLNMLVDYQNHANEGSKGARGDEGEGGRMRGKFMDVITFRRIIRSLINPKTVFARV